MRLKVPLNLASEPFQSTRRAVVGTIAGSVLLLCSLGLLVWLGLAESSQTEDLRNTVARLEARLSKVAAEEARIAGQLRRPENSAVLERSLFLNSLLYTKGISWTRLFDDLETVMPHNVRLVSIRPQVNAGNEVVLDMEVGAESEPPVIQFLVRLENSPQFGITTLQNRIPPSQTEPLLRYRLSASYRQKLEDPTPVPTPPGLAAPAKGRL